MGVRLCEVPIRLLLPAPLSVRPFILPLSRPRRRRLPLLNTFAAGATFGLGLGVAGMTQPPKVRRGFSCE